MFEQVGPSQVALTGILWGGGTDPFGAPVFIFSAFENILLELRHKGLVSSQRGAEGAEGAGGVAHRRLRHAAERKAQIVELIPGL